MTNPVFPQTLAAQSAALTEGQFSSVDLTQHYLERISRLDGQFNSFITVCPDFALAQAAEADRRRAAGEDSPLLGIPYANKDIFCTKGITTTCASRMLAEWQAPYDATVVERLHAAGMVMLGKTNMDEFAMGSSNETSWFGPARNPWDTNRVPGGSSGGSAAAVAARLAPVATGTDTGGSIRQPAALCGVTGLKPTYGRVSRWGMIAFASSLDQGGPMALTAEDLALMLNAMAGADRRDATSIERAPENFLADLSKPLAGLKVVVPSEFMDAGLSPAIRDCVDAATTTLQRLGASIREVSLPHAGVAVPAYYVVASAEASSNLSRYDGVRFGHRCENPVDLADIYFSQGKLAKAEASYRASLQRDPSDLDAVAHLGQCLLRAGRASEAEPLLSRVVAADAKHDYGHTLMALAETQTALGNDDGAAASWRRVLDNNAYARAKVQFAELLAKRGERARARAELEEVVSDDQHAPKFQRDRDKVWVRRARSQLASL